MHTPTPAHLTPTHPTRRSTLQMLAGGALAGGGLLAACDRGPGGKGPPPAVTTPAQ